MLEKTVSVILPTFNGESYLPETLDSIAAQSRCIDELICSDDASTDNTVNLVKQFAVSAPFKVRYFDHSPSGVTANYLNALSKTNGNVILVSDQDDVWMPNKVESIVEAFTNPTVSLVSHDSEIVDSKLRPTGVTLRQNFNRSKRLSSHINHANDNENLLAFLRGGLPLQAHTLAFRRDLIPLLLAKPDCINDWWFEEWVSCIALTTGRLHSLEHALVLYRQHAKQTSGGITGSSDLKNRVVNSVGKYHLRMQKIEYCENIAQTQHQNKIRAQLFSDYHNFLQSRQTLIEGRAKLGSAIKNLLLLLLNGGYKRYAHGVKSFVLDLMTLFRGRDNIR